MSSLSFLGGRCPAKLLGTIPAMIALPMTVLTKACKQSHQPSSTSFCQAVDSEHTDDANVDTVACLLAGLVTAAESDVASMLGEARMTILLKGVYIGNYSREGY